MMFIDYSPRQDLLNEFIAGKFIHMVSSLVSRTFETATLDSK